MSYIEKDFDSRMLSALSRLIYQETTLELEPPGKCYNLARKILDTNSRWECT